MSATTDPRTPKSERFVRVPHWLIDDTNLTHYELWVYVALLKYRDTRTGICYPSLSELAAAVRCSEKSVGRAIKGLAAMGWVEVIPQPKTNTDQRNRYRVATPDRYGEVSFDRAQRRLRITRRNRRTPDSESLVTGSPVSIQNASTSNSWTPDSESVTPDSESGVLGTPSPTNKNQPNKNQEQELDLSVRNEISDGERIEERATEDQVVRLADLHRKVFDQTVDSFVDHIDEWNAMTRTQAKKTIDGYYQRVKRANRKVRAAEFGP